MLLIKKIITRGTVKKNQEHLLLNNKNVPSHYEVTLDSLKWFTGAIIYNFIWSVTLHVKFKSVFLYGFILKNLIIYIF